MLIKLTSNNGNKILVNPADIFRVSVPAAPTRDLSDEEKKRYAASKSVVEYHELRQDGKRAFDFVQENVDEIAAILPAK